MKKVEFVIMFKAPNAEKVAFAIMFTGVATRKYLYVKQSSVSVPDSPMPYIRVKRSDTEVYNPSYFAFKPKEARTMTIISDSGIEFLHDPRITLLDSTDPMIAEVDAYIEEQRKYFEALN